MNYSITLSSDEVEAFYSAMYDYQRKYKGVRHEYWTDVATGLRGKALGIINDHPEAFGF